MKKNNSLLFRVPLYVSLVIVFLGAFATAVVFYFSQEQLVENEKENLVTITEAQSGKVEEMLEHFLEMAEGVSEKGFLKDYLSADEPMLQDPDVLSKLELFEIEDDYSSIYVMSTNGLTLTSTNPSFVNKNYGFRDYFKTALTGNSTIDVSIGVTSDQLGYYFATPIIGDTGILGVLVMKMNPHHIHKTISVEKVSGAYDVLLVDEYGVVVYSNEDKKIYKSLGPLTEREKSAIEEEKRFPGVEILPLNYTDAQNRLAETEGTEIYEIYDSFDNESEIITISKIGQYPFYIFIENHTTELLREASKVGFYLGLIVLFSALAAATMILIILKESLKPLKSLTGGIEEISKGNLDYRVVVEQENEFGVLAASLNRMAKRVKDSRMNIEKRVQERTEKLEKINRLMVGREKKMIDLKKKLKECKGDK